MFTYLTLKVKAVVLVFLLLLFLSPCTRGVCEDQREASPAGNERRVPLQPSSEWNAQIALGYLPSADLRGVNASAAISDYRFRLNRNIRLDSKTTLTVGGAYALKQIDASAGAAL